MPLTSKLDLDIHPLDLHAQIQVCMAVRSDGRLVTHTDDVKTITPDATVECKKENTTATSIGIIHVIMFITFGSFA